MKYFIYGVIGIVALAVISGFFIIGSPMEKRIQRFDEKRSQDLQIIQSEIIRYWQAKEKLPEKIENLKDSISGFIPPKDPKTGEEYDYIVNSVNAFELCAVFSRESQKNIRGKESYYAGPFGENWMHGVGKHCFQRTIDKELYPPLPKLLKD